MRNYLFACLESEARLALLAHGLDPTLGVLHADQRNRDSLALDAMEPVRASVDAFLLDLLEDRVFEARDFAELPNGICRIAAPLTHELALTLPQWRECLRPIAAGLAQTFRNALAGKNGRSTIPASKRSPLVATPRKASQPRPYAAKAWRAPRPEALAANPIACASCGEPVSQAQASALRGMLTASTPRARSASDRGGSQSARSAGCRGQGPACERARRAQARRSECRAASPQSPLGARAAGAERDRAWFEREVVPKLKRFPLNTIARATGLSLAACSRIRAGAQVPHPRHWDSLLALVRG